MANTINTVKDGPGLFAKGVAESLMDNMKLCQFVEKADSSELNAYNGIKPGDTIYTSIPQRKIVQEDNLDITSYTKDVVEEKAPLTFDKTATTADEFDSLELATDIDVKNALMRFGIPSAQALAQKIESRCFGIIKDAVYNSAGTAGSNSFTVSDVLAGKTLLDESLAPLADRMLFLNSRNGAKAVNARKDSFNSSEEIAKQYRDGYIGRADGFDWVETQLTPSHTLGNDVTGVAVNDASVAEGASTLAIDGLTITTGTVKKGTVFTLAGVNKVHPITKEDLGVLQQFVVTADATANGSGQATISISPSLYAGSDGLQNITALPADDAALIFVGLASTTYQQGIALHKSAFKMATAPLYQPKGVDLVASQTVGGITVNIVRDFNVLTRKVITRYDVLYAFDPVRPEWGCKLTA